MGDAVKTGGADISAGAWMEGVQSSEFKSLIDAKVRSIAPMAIIYIIGYLGLSILAGFSHDLLGTKVLGPINLGFVLIIANYIMSWVLAIAYSRVSASTLDPLVKAVVEKVRMKGRGK